jgi:hypothetical protein
MRQRFMHPTRVARRRARRAKIGKFLKNAHGFLKRSRILSKAVSYLPPSPYTAAAKVGLNAVGYGRRRRMCGSGVGMAGGSLRRAGGGPRLAGGSLRLAGAGRRRRHHKKKKACCKRCSR